MKLALITTKTLFIAFFVGQYWFVYCYINFANTNGWPDSDRRLQVSGDT